MARPTESPARPTRRMKCCDLRKRSGRSGLGARRAAFRLARHSQGGQSQTDLGPAKMAEELVDFLLLIVMKHEVSCSRQADLQLPLCTFASCLHRDDVCGDTYADMLTYATEDEPIPHALTIARPTKHIPRKTRGALTAIDHRALLLVAAPGAARRRDVNPSGETLPATWAARHGGLSIRPVSRAAARRARARNRDRGCRRRGSGASRDARRCRWWRRRRRRANRGCSAAVRARASDRRRFLSRPRRSRRLSSLSSRSGCGRGADARGSGCVSRPRGLSSRRSSRAPSLRRLSLARRRQRRPRPRRVAARARARARA